MRKDVQLQILLVEDRIRRFDLNDGLPCTAVRRRKRRFPHILQPEGDNGLLQFGNELLDSGHHCVVIGLALNGREDVCQDRRHVHIDI